MVEEETGAPLEVSRRRAGRGGFAPRRSVAEPRRRERGRLVARDAKHVPLFSTFAWSSEAVERILRVPSGFMRNRTQERVEEIARERDRASITSPSSSRGSRSARS